MHRVPLALARRRAAASIPAAPRFRPLSTARPHPLSNPPTLQSTRKTPPPAPQKWSTLTAILLATLTGTLTYAVGVMSAKGGKDEEGYRPPTRDGFENAMKELREVLPGDCVETDRNVLEAHGWSSWSYHDPEGLPGAVLYPRSTEDVVAIVKLADKYRIPIIPFSGGTSLEGHTQPLACMSNPAEAPVVAKLARGEPADIEEIVPGLAWTLDFSENMNNIIKINEDDLDAIVQPGVGYGVLNETLREQGIPLFFPVDPAPGAQIGGMVGTGASGTNAVRYGTMRENVINLTVVLPSGEVIKTRQRAKKSSAGPDVARMFIGSEGTLGIVTEATLKLAPVLPSRVAVSSFPTIKDAAAAVRDMVSSGVGVSCVELMDDIMIDAVNKASGGGKGGRTWDVKPSLFIKFAGTEGQIKSDIDQTKKITQSHNGSKFTFSRNDKEAEDIWYSRKVALWSAIDYVEGSKCWVTDVCVPISNLPQLVAESKEDMASEGILGPICGHAGDGNFHALLLYKTPEELVKVRALVHRMVERAQRLDGTCTGEHGVGFGKKDHLEHELGAGTVEILRGVKKMLDPKNIFNPGKLLPDLGKQDTFDILQTIHDLRLFGGPPSPAPRSRFHLSPELHRDRAPREVIYDFNLSEELRAVDGVEKNVLLVNGLFPGPTIEVRSGDTLVVNVYNNMTEGAIGVTQPQRRFTYSFKISDTQAGTFWYHSHFHNQRADGLYGAFIIHPPSTLTPPSHPLHDDLKPRKLRGGAAEKEREEELVFMIGDWHQRSGTAIQKWYMSRLSMEKEPVPDNVLINGRQIFECGRSRRPITCDASLGEQHRTLLDPTKQYRLRLVNTGNLVNIHYSIDEHELEVIEADGELITPVMLKELVIAPGQRYSVRLRPREAGFKGTFWMRTRVDPSDYDVPNPSLEKDSKGIIEYGDVVTQTIPTTSRWENLTEDDLLDDMGLLPLIQQDLPETDGDHFMFYVSTSLRNSNGQIPVGYMNQTQWIPNIDNPLLLRHVTDVGPTSLSRNELILHTHKFSSTVVDIIVNNVEPGPHPFHLHGHSFWPLATYSSRLGWGYYPYHNPPALPTTAPALRDTFLVPERGYAVFRVRFDTPGLWMFHCHWLVHQAAGMALTFDVRSSDLPDVERENVARSCKAV
ncbi:hypothetical protein MNV49_007480 [Pseudohyphozyma bogoriensis]|nr:hypothetical protein MNV49_007480 [Pseudohyphozyma bogoriensis]